MQPYFGTWEKMHAARFIQPRSANVPEQNKYHSTAHIAVAVLSIIEHVLHDKVVLALAAQLETISNAISIPQRRA